jgi:hypothetical protein
MHDIILKRLCSLHGLSSEQELSNFLRWLRSTARCLWKAYQANVVNVSYRKQTVQAAYMLRYFAHYAEVTFDQDRVLDCNPILERMLRILTENLFVRKISGNEIAPDEDGLICTMWVPHHCLALQRI